MANQQWVSLLNSGSVTAAGAGTALNTATTAVISPVYGAGPSDVAAVQASGQFGGWYPGLLVRVTARGILTTTATSTTATLLLRARLDNSGTATVATLATAVGITTGTTVLTGIPWELSALIRCTAIASSGNTVSTMGRLDLGNSGAALAANPIALTGTSGIGPLFLPNSAGETAAAVDTTRVQGIGLWGTLAGANATLQVIQWLAEALD